MLWKIGGGQKLQAYSPDNGQYTKMDKIEMLSADYKALTVYMKNSIIQYTDSEPHIPMMTIHNFNYTYDFIDTFKSSIKSIEISENKALFLLNGIKKPERTKWLNKNGFSLTNVNDPYNPANFKDIIKFQKYIKNNTDLNSLYFWGFNKDDGTMACNALTNINGYWITTGWKIDSNFDLKFVTLIETSKVYYEKKSKIRR